MEIGLKFESLDSIRTQLERTELDSITELVSLKFPEEFSWR